MMLKSILCPVDFSPQSRAALVAAVALAQRFGGGVDALFVNDPLLLAAGSREYGGKRRFVERTRHELSRFVAHAMRSGRNQITVQVHAAEGAPGEEILRRASQLQSDVIVMGTHGSSGARKFFFGSTTEMVLRQARIPVLAVPPVAGRRPAPLVVRRVVAAIDLAGDWQPDVARAAEIALAFGADLHLVHVLAPVQWPGWLESAKNDRPRITKATRMLDRIVARLRPHVRVTSSIKTGDAADEIARLARRGTLVVMSLRGGAGVFGARRGSIAYRVLVQSAAPLLALPRRRLGGRFARRAARAFDRALSERDRVELAGIDALLSLAGSRRPRSAVNS